MLHRTDIIAQSFHRWCFGAVLECASHVRSGASPAASGAEDGADSGDNMDSFIVREDPPAAPVEPQVLHRVRACHGSIAWFTSASAHCSVARCATC